MANINTKLSLNGCRKMVNAIQNGKTVEEIKERCMTAAKWLKANEVISNADFDDLMMDVTWIYRNAKNMVIA